MPLVKITIDGKAVEVDSDSTILEAAQKAGIYIPALCHHPDLPPAPGMKSSSKVFWGNLEINGEENVEYEGCKLCVVKVEGETELVTSCNTKVKDGMTIWTDTPEIREYRTERLTEIMKDHPHACLLCAQREGCTREPCSTNVPVEERCCIKFGNCELQKIVEYVGIREDIPKYKPKGYPVIEDEPLFKRDFNLCIACLRCVRACKDLRGVEALSFTYKDGKFYVGPIASTLAESGCRFCGACVEVCPTGAILDKIVIVGEREKALVPCKANCPAEINIPEYVRLISEERFDEALQLIMHKAPLPTVLGYVCHHPCEENCRRGEVNQPISIRNLKRFVSENAKKTINAKKPATGKKIAIIGSGPAGLTAAYYLAKMGHEVTIIEEMPEPGGMLRYGIPAYRLPKDILQREIKDIINLGVKIETNTKVGRDISLEELKQKYNAILIAAGAQKSKKLKIDGADLEGVYWALDFLKAVNLGNPPKIGEKVLVIGGGGVAIDAALTSLRLGAKSVELACLESRDEMPAHPWEIEQALEEGIKINNSWGPQRIIGEKHVEAVELIRCTRVFDEDGRFNPQFDPSQTTKITADTVIFAIGQEADLTLIENTSIKAERNLIQVSEDLMAEDGVFACGDVVSGPSSVIEAIAMGRKAAQNIDKYLGGTGEIPAPQIEPPSHKIGRIENFAGLERVSMPTLKVEERIGNFKPIELGYSREEALKEAIRCLRCHLRLMIKSPPTPPEKLLPFNQETIEKVPETAGVFELLDAEKMVVYIAGTMNLKQALTEQLDKEDVKYFRYEEHEMYTMRESELLQKFLQKHGRMPKYNVELEDLY